MVKKIVFSMFLCLVYSALTVLSGCQNSYNAPLSDQTRVTEEELRAYCPMIYMREDGSYYNTYTRGGDNDPEKIIYQVSISEVTRSCKYIDGQLQIKAAASGRIVPGPNFKPGTIALPIRVTVLQGDVPLYSKLHKYALQAKYGTEAVQFIFLDDKIILPKPTQQNLRIYIAFEPAGK